MVKEVKNLSGKALKTVRSKIAWIPQDLGLVPNLRVNQNISCGRASEKGFLGLMRSLLLMGSREKEEVADLLRRVGIEEKIFHRVDHPFGWPTAACSDCTSSLSTTADDSS
jgi:ABC-type phosphate/phosphonate transport system ATPase subunit